jgi:hypothetical protein
MHYERRESIVALQDFDIADLDRDVGTDDAILDFVVSIVAHYDFETVSNDGSVGLGASAWNRRSLYGDQESGNDCSGNGDDSHGDIECRGDREKKRERFVMDKCRWIVGYAMMNEAENEKSETTRISVPLLY